MSNSNVREHGRNAALVFPLVLVNSAAIFGQTMFFHENVTNEVANGFARMVFAISLAVALESIGVYLAYEAHAALLAGDASGKLRVASYGVALIVASLNYAHFANDLGNPTAVALTFALLSAISPWLWGIRSRSINRDRLRALELIDERGPHFSATRKLLFPVRTYRVFRHAVWHSIVNPRSALDSWESTIATVTNEDAGTDENATVTATNDDTDSEEIDTGELVFEDAPAVSENQARNTEYDGFVLPAGISKREAYAYAWRYAKGDRKYAYRLLMKSNVTIDAGYAHTLARDLEREEAEARQPILKTV